MKGSTRLWLTVILMLILTYIKLCIVQDWGSEDSQLSLAMFVVFYIFYSLVAFINYLDNPEPGQWHYGSVIYLLVISVKLINKLADKWLS